MTRIAVLLLPLAIACIPNDTLVLPDGMVTECSGEVPATLRVMSYNVKSGAQTSLEEVGDVIVAQHPDLLALQEVNVDLEHQDQVQLLAARLGFPYVYAAALSRGLSHTYGNALISRYPLKRVERIDLRASGAAEPRVAIDVTLCAGATEVRVLATHADVWKPSPNIDTLCGHLAAKVESPTILLGDLNVRPTDAEPGTIAAHGLVDLIGKLAEGATFWSDGKRLDYLYVDPSLEAKATGASIGSSKASDHHPIWADFALK